jgi:hypothetical protein
LGKIACGDFAGHHCVDRGQKTRLLPATHTAALAGDSSDISFVASRERRDFRGLRFS